MRYTRLFPKIIYTISHFWEMIVMWVVERYNQYYSVGLCQKHGVAFDAKSIRFYGKPNLDFEDGANVTIGSDFICRSSVKGGVIDNHTCSKIRVKSKATLTIGSKSGVSNTSIYCANRITIGDYVNIGSGTLIIDTDAHSLDWKERLHGAGVSSAKTAPIMIQDFAFIGANTLILKGVIIGKYAIVGAGSVVTCDIPEGEVWAGNPARKVSVVNY